MNNVYAHDPRPYSLPEIILLLYLVLAYHWPYPLSFFVILLLISFVVPKKIAYIIRMIIIILPLLLLFIFIILMCKQGNCIYK